MTDRINGNTASAVTNAYQNQTEQVQNKNIPDEFHNASSSKLAKFGRVLLGIVTLGISEGVIAIVKHFSKGDVATARTSEPNIGFQEAPQPKLLNGQTLLNEMVSDNPKLDQVYKNAIEDAYKEIQKGFPEYKGSTWSDFIMDTNLKYERKKSFDKFVETQNGGDYQNPISAETFKQGIIFAMKREIKKSAVNDQIQTLLSNYPEAEKLSDKKIESYSKSVLARLQRMDPENTLDKASNPDELKQAITNFKDEIKNSFELCLFQEKTVAKTMDQAAEELAVKTGIDKKDVLDLLKKSKLKLKLDSTASDLSTGRTACKGLQDAEKILNEKKAEFLSNVNAMIDQINGLEISDNTRKEMISSLLTSTSMISSKTNAYTEIFNLIDNIKDNLTETKNAIQNKQEPKIIFDALLNELYIKFENMLSKPDSQLGKAWREPDPSKKYGADEQNFVNAIITQILFDKVPDLKNIISSDKDFVDNMSEQVTIEQREPEPDKNAPIEEKELFSFKHDYFNFMNVFLSESYRLQTK